MQSPIAVLSAGLDPGDHAIEDVLHHIAVHEICIRGGPVNTMGRFSDLFLGYHITAGKVALKRLRQLDATEKEIRNFLREAKIWRDLRHDHVLPFIGTYECPNGHLHLVSPYAENGDLLTYVNRFPHCDKARLLREAADAIVYLHECDIVHGDIKARNILVSAQHHVLLCDFGLSRLTEAMANLSSESQGAGTLRWQSPEIMEGQPKSARSDIYAFGITIFEVLSGEPPWSKQPLNATVILLVMRGKRPPKEPRRSLSGISYDRLWEVAERCWAHAPEDRPLRPNQLLAGIPHCIPATSSARNRATSVFGLSPLQLRRKLSTDSTMTASSAYTEIDDWGPRTPIDEPMFSSFVHVMQPEDGSCGEGSVGGPLKNLAHRVLGAPQPKRDDLPLSAQLQALAFVSFQDSVSGAQQWTIHTADAFADRVSATFVKAALLANAFSAPGGPSLSAFFSRPHPIVRARQTLHSLSAAITKFVQTQIDEVHHRLVTPPHRIAQPPPKFAKELAEGPRRRPTRQFTRSQSQDDWQHPQPQPLFSQQLIRPGSSAAEFLTRLHAHPVVRTRVPILGTTSLLLFGAVRTFVKPMNGNP